MVGFNRREFGLTAIATGLFFNPAARAYSRTPRPADASYYSLWYRQPAVQWVEALPVGTGRFGAMVFGGTDVETLQLNEDTFWAGGPYDPVNPEAKGALEEVRRLIFAGQYREAQDLANQKMMARPLSQMPYQTLGNLTLRMAEQGRPEEYVRWLDLEMAETVTRWKAGGRSYERRVLANIQDQVVLVRLKVDEGPIDLEVDSAFGLFAATEDVFLARGTNTARHGVEGALRATLGLMPVGSTQAALRRDGQLVISGEGEVAFVLAAATNHVSWKDVSGDPDARVRDTLSAAAKLDVEAIVERQLEAYQEQFLTFQLSLGDDPFPDVATDDRIRYSHEMNRHDPYLAELYFYYGRYLLISSSQPGSQPANLQGIWNNSFDPAWGSKYTININTEMNYWPAEPTGLQTCVEPLIAMVEELAESGARTARDMYGARGWVAHHNTDLWRASAPIDGAFWGMWPTGGAWLCQHLWDHWDYGRDRAVLERIYPVIRDAGLFFLDTMVEHPDGSGLVTCPSNSPENAHRPGVTICAGPACDRQILRNLFGNVIAASRELGVDEALRAEFEAALARIPGDRIGMAGQVQEWLEDWDLDAPEIQHRHVSHLYAVHPGHEIGPETPELYKAAARSLAIRGDDATGWGIGWRINLWARLGDAERAYTVLRKLLGPDRTYPNMFDAHPPFQIDGNFGGTAGILEMIVRDRPQMLELLPALPARAWPEGRVAGVRLRGGLTMDFVWEDGKALSALFDAKVPVSRKLKVGDAIMTLELEAGESRGMAFDE